MPHTIRFDAYEVDLPAGQLYKHGVKIGLREKSFQVLEALLEHPGEVVTREELQRRLWRDEVFVDFDNNLNTAIARLREALCDSAEHPHFIETLPKRGYRFLAKICEPPQAQEETPTRRARLAVLPFLNLSGDPAHEFFADAMTDEIITEFAALAPERLAVIARTTAMLYKGSHKDVARIARELTVAYGSEGGVRPSDSHLAVNVQLIQGSDQAHIFAKKYEAEMHDVFCVQTCIAKDIAKHIPCLSHTLRIGEQVRRKPTNDLVAYQLYLQGRCEMLKTPMGFTKAKHYLEQAIARDPQFALAYDALGEYYFWIGFFGFAPPKEAFSASLWAALHAIEIDDTLGETHGLLGQLRQQLDYNWAEDQREMALALKLNPGSPLVRFRYAGSGLLPHGKLKEAIAELECGLQFDPLSVLLHVWLSVVLWLARDYERAMQEARLVDQLVPDYDVGHLLIGHIWRDMGAFQDSIAAYRCALELSGGAHQMLGWLGLTLAQSGNTAEARTLLQQLHAKASQTYVSPTCFAWIHLGLVEIDDAFVWRERAIEARDPNIIPLKTVPFLAPLRADPRVAELLRKMNLAP